MIGINSADGARWCDFECIEDIGIEAPTQLRAYGRVGESERISCWCTQEVVWCFLLLVPFCRCFQHTNPLSLSSGVVWGIVWGCTGRGGTVGVARNSEKERNRQPGRARGCSTLPNERQYESKKQYTVPIFELSCA